MHGTEERYDKRYYNKLSHKGRYIRKDSRIYFANWMFSKIKKLQPDAFILDIGCGDGFYIKIFEREMDCIGVEISISGLKMAKRGDLRSPLIIGDAHDLPFKDRTFNFILALDVIEHLKKPEVFLKEIKRVLQKNGYLLISTPNLNSFGSRRKGGNWFGYRDTTHISLKTPDQWHELLTGDFQTIKEGTDSLWDIPYFKTVPGFLQKLFFVPFNVIIKRYFGFLPWRRGENYMAILQKR